MKQFIVLMGVLPLMMIFIMQFTLEQTHSRNMAVLQDCVYAAKEQAKQDGYFTDTNINLMKAKLATAFQIGQDEILVDVTRTPKYRVNQFDERELIHYKISVPIHKIMAGANFLGIKEKENRGMYTIENYAASERLIR